MNPFAIAQPPSFESASRLMKDGRYRLPVIKAGGMDVVDHLKEGLIEPDVLIDIRALRRGNGGGAISLIDGIDREPQVEIEATATLSDMIRSRMMRQHAPVVIQALEFAATPQVRNVATAAGNLLQRPRCWYYRNQQFDCLKKGGDACYAIAGENQYHAIFGNGPCHMVHPSNLAPALMVCNGNVHLVGSSRDSVSIAELYHAPDDDVTSEHNLAPGEVITHISLESQPTSGFYAIKEKQSFDWPLVMAAVSLELDGEVIRRARVCAGAVAPVPWPLPEVEQALSGVRVDNDKAVQEACSRAAAGAHPMRDNNYKLTLLPVAVTRAVRRAAGRPFEE